MVLVNKNVDSLSWARHLGLRHSFFISSVGIGNHPILVHLHPLPLNFGNINSIGQNLIELMRLIFILNIFRLVLWSNQYIYKIKNTLTRSTESLIISHCYIWKQFDQILHIHKNDFFFLLFFDAFLMKRLLLYCHTSSQAGICLIFFLFFLLFTRTGKNSNFLKKIIGQIDIEQVCYPSHIIWYD